MLFCICWLVPASIVYAITDFSFFDSCYFSMVTFTTVGFGDYTITGYNLKFFIVCFSYFGWVFQSLMASNNSRPSAFKLSGDFWVNNSIPIWSFRFLFESVLLRWATLFSIQTCMDWYRDKLSNGQDSVCQPVGI